MKKLIQLLLIITPLCSLGQVYDNIVTFYKNDFVTAGIRIKTQIPFSSLTHMPNVRIEGFDGGTTTNIGLNISWTLEDIGGGLFMVYGVASSWGGFTPPIYLSNVNGKVNIFLSVANTSYYPRFKISAFAQGLDETSGWFTNWQVIDSAISGTSQTLVPYYNQFGGSLNIGGNVSAAGVYSTGNVNGNNVSATNNVSAKTVNAGMIRSLVNPSTNNPIQYNGYFNSTANCHFSQNGYVPYTVYGGTPVDQWKSWGSKATYGSAVVLKTDGKSGKAFNISVDTTISQGDELLSFTDLFTVTTAGKVGIGTATPSELLSVNGNIVSKKVKATPTGWADFVFEKDYKLMSLAELEVYIKKHLHLPGVPTTATVVKEGTDVAEIQTILLQKIEELTLYIIQQQKQIDEQQKEVKELKKKVLASR